MRRHAESATRVLDEIERRHADESRDLARRLSAAAYTPTPRRRWWPWKRRSAMTATRLFAGSFLASEPPQTLLAPRRTGARA